MSDLAKIVAHAWTDKPFKKKLLTHPVAALAEHGVKVRKGVTVEVMENTADSFHLVLPVAPARANELTAEELLTLARRYQWKDRAEYDLYFSAVRTT